VPTCTPYSVQHWCTRLQNQQKALHRRFRRGWVLLFGSCQASAAETQRCGKRRSVVLAGGGGLFGLFSSSSFRTLSTSRVPESAYESCASGLYLSSNAGSVAVVVAGGADPSATPRRLLRALGERAGAPYIVSQAMQRMAQSRANTRRATSRSDIAWR
jgi:hypothetical protein